MGERCYRLCEIAAILGGSVEGDGEILIRGVAGIREAGPGDITFVANPKYEEFLASTRASAVIAGGTLSTSKPLIRTGDPYYAYFQVLNMFAADHTVRYPRGVHPKAVVDPSARLGENVAVGPWCQIGREVTVGDGTTILSGAFVGEGTTIGRDCMVYSNVTIRENSEMGDRVILQPGVVIGADGFGYAKNGGVHHKVPQIGRVVIEDDVEVGANSCVDRATTGETRIRRGSKIDNLVQIAHNVVVGENCIIAAQAGVSGSTELGDNVMLGGQAGLVGHIALGSRVIVGAQAGVTKSVPAGTTVSGYPAREHGAARRIQAHVSTLPELVKRVRELERRIAELEKGGARGQAAADDR